MFILLMQLLFSTVFTGQCLLNKSMYKYVQERIINMIYITGV